MRNIAAVLTGGVLVALSATSCFAENAPRRMTPMQAVNAPPGYVDFCARSPQDCGSSSVRQELLAMDAERWREVSALNMHINQSVTSGSDEELFGEPEHWAVAGSVGDCEDYVLRKKRELEALGYPSSVLLITVVLDERQEGHAVLTIAADSGDYVLDNRRDEILPFTSTGYQYLKRQSQLDPLRWVSLVGLNGPASGDVASRSP
ncbi:MAG: transglutaminase-like cysteine peptidase [Aestuariivirgaceae bacterium]|nr:transglutaminase-like cysteine peptidase [Aestuariivirgaceae bacterium]